MSTTALSDNQRALWFMVTLAPTSAAFNTTIAAWVRGHVDVAALRRAALRLAERHPLLRTRVTLVDDEPRLSGPWPAELPVEASALAGASEAEVLAALTSAIARPFDLMKEPPARVHLIRRGERDFAFALVIHHIAADLEALATAMDELWRLHADERGVTPWRAAAPAGSYPEFVRLQAEGLAGPAGARLAAYWTERLAGAPTLQMPLDRPRPRRMALAGSHHPFVIAGPELAAVRELARASGVSLASALLAAWAALLLRHSGQDEVVVGVPAAGRRGANSFAGVVGTFVNTLPIRVSAPAEQGLRGLLAQVQASMRAAVEHEAFPFNRMVELLAPARDLSRTPLFQAGFAIQRVPRLQETGMAALLAPAAAGRTATVRDGLEFAATPVSQQNGQYELALWVLEQDGALWCEIKYDAGLFEPATIAELARRFNTLLMAATAGPEQLVARLPLVDAEERAALRAAVTRPGPKYDARPLHRTFAAQAARMPDATAVTYEDRSLTYAELDAQANRLAHRLLRLGVGRGARVGLCVERSLALVVGILGVLKVGAAYVPMDPRYPAERLALLVGDADCAVVVTQRGVAVAGARLEVEDLAGEPTTDPGVAVDGEDVAYVMYTSGSTGTPKGVAVTHANVARLFTATEQLFGFAADDVWSMFHSFAFDFSVWELWGALLYGGRVVVVPHWTTRTPDAFHSLLRREGVTVLNQTPSAFAQLAAVDARAGGASRLRWLIFGGEALDPSALRGWVERRGDLQPAIVNMYGITETTVHVTYRRILAADLIVGGSPIGEPLPDVQVHLLDAAGEPVPVGVPGEMFVGGAGVARGYHARPELTAARFVAPPWDPQGARLYRSGDLARRRRDGGLEFLGRADAQVKIRGFRIEPGEVEAALRRIAGVAEARVLAREDPAGGKRLVAYVVADDGATIDTAGLATLLGGVLPPQMVPTAYAVVAALPLTAHGKLDVSKLPEPAAARRGAGEPPRGPVERRLAELWRRVLGLAEAPGRDDGFFALGGHSLLAAGLRAAIEREFGVRVGLAEIFEAPTIAGLAPVVAGASAAEPGSVIEPDPAHAHAPFPLTDTQQAYWIGRSTAMALGGVGSQVYWEFAAAGLDVERLARAWRGLVARHGMLRAVVGADGLQRVLAEVPAYAIEVLDLRAAVDPAPALAGVKAAMTGRVFAAEVWPLFEIRATLLAGGEVRLHVGFDALIADAASIFQLLDEWARRYADADAALPGLAIGFRDYVLATQANEAGPRGAAAAAYWTARLASLPPPPPLPLVRAPAAGEAPVFVRRTTRLAGPRWQALQARARAEGLTPSGLLCAAYAEVLGTWSAAERFVINVTTFSRLPLHPDVERVVGDFTSLLLLAVERGGATFRARARALQGQLAADLEHAAWSGVRVLREARRRGLSATAPVVFTSALVHQHGERGGFPALFGRRVDGVAQTPQVWLDHVVFEEDGELVCVWDAVEALFVPGVLDAMVAAHTELLGELADDGARWVRAERSLTPAAERAVLRPVGAAPQRRLHDGFLEQAEREPRALAVITGDRTWTYGELRTTARRLAWGLRRAGVGAGARVAVVLDKGFGQVAAVLAILMAGAAYVPVDPALPELRVRRLLRHAEVVAAVSRRGLDAVPAGLVSRPSGSALVSRSSGSQSVSRPSEPGLVRVDVDDPALAELPDEALANDAGPGDLAYIIYTSGSTGEPKGVMIDHRGACGTIAEINARFAVGPGDRVLALSSLSFDLSVYDVFGLLAAGGAIVVPPADATRDPGCWAALARAHAVTVWNSVPALLDMFVRHADGRRELAAPALRLALLSGDWIPVRLPDAVRELHPGAQVVSLGGATEASIWSIVFPIDAVDPAWTSIPYGKPLGGQTIHVLDARGEACPIGVAGQIHIGGAGLAIGYQGDEARTQAAFFRLADGERVYRTGDLGRRLASGDVELLGREDLQVKIQGHRVELGEIEAALLLHPDVAAAAVVARGEARGSRQLVGYFVARALDGEKVVRRTEAAAPHLDRPRVALPRVEQDPDLWRGRRSVRRWTREAVPLAALAALLAALAPLELAESAVPRRRYGSAGGLYPVRAYVVVEPGRVEGLAGGAYLVEPDGGALVELSLGTGIELAAHGAYNRGFVGAAAFTVVLVADLGAIEPAYGGRARDFCLLEAGAMSQLLMTAAPAAGLGLCAIGGIDDAGVRAALGLGAAEELVHLLVGGVPAGEAAAPLVDRLREHLAGCLPAYMVPPLLVPLAALPLSSNGKVDRAALPAPEAGEVVAAAPSGAREQAVAAIVGEVLGVAETLRLGVDVPFFAAGATSLHLVRIHARVREAFAVDLAITEVFNYPTIRALAERLGPAPADADAASERGRERARARLQSAQRRR